MMMKPENSILSANRGNQHPQTAPCQHSPRPQFKQTLLFSAIACLFPTVGHAAPQSGDVVSGQATITTPDANTTVIQQSSDRSIINWQSFSIGSDEYVQFVQPDTTSISLNRVIGGSPSEILGNLSANGQVYLVNPNGIYFGQNVQVDVSGLSASVLDISNRDFLNSNFVFTRDPDGAPGSVINDGLITARNNGYVVLMGDYTQNNGVIQAHMGEVVLASGSHITMDISGNNLISVAVNEATVQELAGVDNSGEIYADGGRVLMTARVANELVSTAVNNGGLIQANSIVEQDGEIYLTASGGNIVNSGRLDASAAVDSNANGGDVLVYSDRDITLSTGAEIIARGDGSATGGQVRVIAEDRFEHHFGATIDTSSPDGKGGFVEVSGHGSLALSGDINVGRGGEVLIDPATLTIVNSNASAGFTTGGTLGTAGFVGKTLISNQLNTGANVTLVASGSINAAAGSLGGSSFSINANSVGAGDLTIVNGTVGTGGSFAACVMTGFCVPGGTASVTPGATGNINLGSVSISLAGNLNIAAGSTAGNASIGFINVDGITLVTAGNDINFQKRMLGATGASVVANAGNDININGGIGTSDGTYNATVTLNARNNVNINSNRITIGTGNLILAANTDGTLGGDVNINGSTTQQTSVSLGDDLIVSGDNFNVNGADFGVAAVTIGSAKDVSVQANNISINVANQVNLNAGRVNLADSGGGTVGTQDVSVSLNATTNIDITAGELNVNGGIITASQSSCCAFVTAYGNASMNAGNDVNINVTGNLTVQGGNASGLASFYSSGSARAFANASINATNNLNVTNVGGIMTVQAGPANVSMTGVVEGIGSAQAQANASLGANNITVTSAGALNVRRGDSNALISSLSTGTYNATASANASIVATQTVSLNVTGDVNLDGTFSNSASAAVASHDTGNYSVTANSNVLVQGTNVSITTTNGQLRLAGGNVSLSAIPTAGATVGHAIVSQANATTTINASQNVAINLAGVGKNLTMGGGTGTAAVGSFNCNCTASADASVAITGSTVNVTVTSGNLNVLGGAATSASVDASGSAKASVKTGALLESTQEMLLNVGGSVTVGGGLAIANGGAAFNGAPTAAILNSSSASANASIKSGTNLTLNAATGITIAGGAATATPSASVDTRIANASAVATISATGFAAIDVSAGGLTINKGLESANVATLPDVITADASANLSAGSLLVTASGSINGSSAVVNVASDATISAGGLFSFDAASSLNIGGNVDISAGGPLVLNSILSFGGSSLRLAAGSDLSLGTHVGSSAARQNADITLTAGNNVTINSDIFLTNNSLVISADTDGDNFGNVNVAGSTSEARDITTLGSLNISGVNFNLIGTNIVTAGDAQRAVTVSADDSNPLTATDNVTINLTGQMNQSAGAGNVTGSGDQDASVLINAGNNIVVNAAGLSINGGNAVANASSADSSVANVFANASMTAGADITLALTGALAINAGNAVATAYASLAASAATALADASANLTAGGNVVISSASSLIVGAGNATATVGNGTASCSTCDASALANVTLSGQNITVATITGNTALSGGQAVANVLAGSTASMALASVNADANVALNATQNITIVTSGSLDIFGSSAAIGGNLASAAAVTLDASATATINAGQNVTLNAGGSNNLFAGNAVVAGSWTGAGNAVANADVSGRVTAGSNVVMTSDTELNVFGGSVNASPANGGATTGTASANASAVVSAGGLATLSVTSGSLFVFDGTASPLGTIAGSPNRIARADGSVNAGSLNINVSADVNAISSGSLTATGSMTVVAGGNITGSNANLSAAAMVMTAGTNLNLQTSTVSIGSGTVAGVTGDVLLLNTMANAGITVPANSNPNGKFVAGGTLTMGTTNLSGADNYLWLVADQLFSNTVTTSGGNLLMQFSPFTPSNTIKVEEMAPVVTVDSGASSGQLMAMPVAGQTDYYNVDHFMAMPATTIAIGGTAQTGNIIAGADGPVNMGSKNMVFVNSPINVDSILNVVTTGIVANGGAVGILEPLVNLEPEIFIIPVVEELEVDETKASEEDDDAPGKTELVENETEDDGMCRAI